MSAPLSSVPRWFGVLLVSGGAAFAISLAVWLGYALPSLDQWHALWREELAQSLATSTYVTPLPPTSSVVPIEVDAGVLTDSVRLARRVSPVGQLLHRTVGETQTKVMGSVISLTNDGWLATSESSVGVVHTGEYSVLFAGVSYPVEKMVEDVSTGVVYLKITAKDLAVAAFARSEEPARGTVLFMEPASRWLPATLMFGALFEVEASHASERATRRLLLSERGPVHWSGGAVWNVSGELVGMLEQVDEEGWRVIPSRFIASGFTSLLTEGKITRATLGVRSMELSGLSYGTVANVAQGAWVKGDKGGVAVSAQGPAVKKILEGDVIQSVDRDVLDGTVDLGERLLDYRPGSTVTLRGMRNGKPFQVDVKLGSVSTSEVIK